MCLFWSIAERQGVISIMNLIAENRIGSPFVTPVAVEAWDTWFRRYRRRYVATRGIDSRIGRT